MDKKLQFLTAVFALYLQKGENLSPDAVKKARDAAKQILAGLPAWMETLGGCHTKYEQCSKEDENHPLAVQGRRYYRAMGAAALAVAGVEPEYIVECDLHTGMCLGWLSDVDENRIDFAEHCETFVYLGNSVTGFPYTGGVRKLFAAAENGKLDD